MAEQSNPAPGHDPIAPDVIIRSKSYRALLVLAAAIGVLVSLAAWCFLELVHLIQVAAFEDLPSWLGYATAPWWWPLPVLGLAGLIVAFAIARMPGDGGHVPAKGLQAGSLTLPTALPGVMLAALASIGLGFVLGPEGPLIALASGLALVCVGVIKKKKELPDQVPKVLAAAASFAALATIFGNPIVGAVIIIEAAGLGGATMRLVLLPGLVAAGIGSLVFIGMGHVSGLSSGAYAISPLTLPAYAEPTIAAFIWSIVLAVVVAGVTFAIINLGQSTHRLAEKRPFVVIPLAGLMVAALAIAFSQWTGQPASLVLLSGQDAMNPLIEQAATLPLSTLALLFLFKGLAWGVSLGSARGGPTFPAIFLGIVAGLLAAQLPGFAETPAVAALIGAMCVSMLRLPLSSIVLAMLVSQSSLATAPLIIVAVVAAYITTEILASRRAPAATLTPAVAGSQPPV